MIIRFFLATIAFGINGCFIALGSGVIKVYFFCTDDALLVRQTHARFSRFRNLSVARHARRTQRSDANRQRNTHHLKRDYKAQSYKRTPLFINTAHVIYYTRHACSATGQSRVSASTEPVYFHKNNWLPRHFASFITSLSVIFRVYVLKCFSRRVQGNVDND